MAANDTARSVLGKYVRIIEGFAEPDLSAPDFSRRASEAFRVLRLPSFFPSVAVRLELSAAGAVLTRAIGQVRRPEHREAMIDAVLIDPIRETWCEPTLWRDDRPRQLGLDGESWVLEWRNGEEYRIAEAWSPQAVGRDSDIRSAGEQLLALSSQLWPLPY